MGSLFYPGFTRSSALASACPIQLFGDDEFFVTGCRRSARFPAGRNAQGTKRSVAVPIISADLHPFLAVLPPRNFPEGFKPQIPLLAHAAIPLEPDLRSYARSSRITAQHTTSNFRITATMACFFRALFPPQMRMNVSRIRGSQRTADHAA